MRLLITTQVVDRTHSNLGFFHGWIQEFANHCSEVHVICLQEGNHQFSGNIHVHSLGKEGGTGKIGRIIRFYRYLWELRDSYDAVFVHMNPEYLVLAGIVWRAAGKRIVLWYVHKSITIRLRFGALFAHLILTASLESIRINSSKIRSIGHGIDTELFLPLERPASKIIHIISVGRIAPSKGLLEILSALDILALRGVAFELSIVGAPLTEQEHIYDMALKRAIADRSYSKNVHMVGPLQRKELPNLFRQASVLVNISTTGGYDKVVLEALASGVPAISSSEPFRELLEPSGLFIAVVGPDMIADAIVRSKTADITALSQKVRKEHSLKQLISTVISFLRV